ncbi:hypothetical protein BDV25DRAFT_164023 [Aspergillus avenaceus]|uniref:F-box domain-containing protein n=1 Tax=Aspergillus avenaceus TaxID=36643 RepID=A0A5N6THZ1_ASPAV|nr:hypothetical protein BDV25DRAFT_164023 [Aspergillus avenaceus]
MSKRCNDGDLLAPYIKRSRIHKAESSNCLSSLSDELLLHILSFLPISSLLLFQSVSRRFHSLAGDSELWKRKYYSQWVRPRARRLASSKHSFLPLSNVGYSPRVSKWLGHSHLTKEGKSTDWQKQYRLRYNWSKGICRATTAELPESLQPPTLVKFCARFVITVDHDHGLRVWDAGNPIVCLAKTPLIHSKARTFAVPTSLAASYRPSQDAVIISVGFKNSHFSVYSMETETPCLTLCFSHCGPAVGAITTIASSYPYIVTLSCRNVLSLYRLPTVKDIEVRGQDDLLEEASLLTSLQSNNITAPMTLSVRNAGSDIISSIVYSFYHMGCGWSIGIQEVHFNERNQQISSRSTTTADCQFGVVSSRPFNQTTTRQQSSLNDYLHRREPSILHREPPTSVSYSHPYLLSSHTDNTLTMHLVVSTASSLYIKGGQRLWGHTSSVSAVQVSDRGKAVSVSSGGGGGDDDDDDVRIWELENLISSFGTQKTFGEKGVQIIPDSKQGLKHEDMDVLSGVPRREPTKDRSSSRNKAYGLARKHNLIGFNDERVLFLRETDMGKQLLKFYDFT